MYDTNTKLHSLLAATGLKKADSQGQVGFKVKCTDEAKKTHMTVSYGLGKKSSSQSSPSFAVCSSKRAHHFEACFDDNTYVSER